MLVMREKGISKDDVVAIQDDEDFKKEWREKTKWVLIEEGKRRERMMKAQLREEGRAQRKEEEEMKERKRKRDHDDAWDKTREQRIGSWREFQGGTKKEGGKKMKKKVKTLG